MQLYEYIGWKFAIFNVYNRLSGIKAGRISPVLIPLNLVWDGNLTQVRGRVRQRTMSGAVRGLAESSVPGGGCREGGIRPKIKCCGDRLHSVKYEAVLSS